MNNLTNKILAQAPENFVIKNAIERCIEVVDSHNKIMCSVSGGADSDVMLDMLIRCGAKDKTTFVFYDTGLEYSATRRHIAELNEKYDIEIVVEKAQKSIPVCVTEYGAPFWSKYASEMISRLQSHNFKFVDEPFDVLIEKYPNCKVALEWWCNIKKGNTTQYIIDRAPHLKEFMISNPPDFKISNKCCTYAKKKVAEKFCKSGGYDLVCTGVRQTEGGIRSITYKNCFTNNDTGANMFRPIYWLRDDDKIEYCSHYHIVHSDCYSKYGLIRTGCFGCPFGKRYEEELECISRFEPKLLTAAYKIFGQSYEYTRRYLEFRRSKNNN